MTICSVWGDPRDGGARKHQGNDLCVGGIGVPFASTKNLEVVDVRNNGGSYGLWVDLKDSNGTIYRMAHLDSTDLKIGDKVDAGNVLAFNGNTGNAVNTTPHAHVEVIVNGQKIDPQTIDPATNQPYIDAIKVKTDTGLVDPRDTTAAAPGKVVEGYDPKGGAAKNAGIEGDPDAVKSSGTVPGPKGGAPGAGGAGGGAGCVGAAVNPAKLTVMAGLMQGLGAGIAQGAMGAAVAALSGAPGASILGAAAGGVMNGLGGAVGGVLQQALGGIGALPSQLAENLLGPISKIGADLIPGLGNVLSGTLESGLNQLLSPLNAVIQNPFNIIGVAKLFTSTGGLAGFLGGVAGNMAGTFAAGATSAFTSAVFNTTGGTINNLMGNVSQAAAVAFLTRGIVGGAAEAMGQAFGNGVGGLGALFKNNEGVATYGASALSDNLALLASDMIAMGDWDTGNLNRLMQPGNIAAQIIARGLGEATGLYSAITKQNIPLAGIDSAVYDKQVQAILDTINSDAAIAAVAKEFKVRVTITNLGQLTDLKIMMPNVADDLSVNDFAELGQMLKEMQITDAPDMTYIGEAFLKLETTKDLNHISQQTSPIHKPSAELVLKTFGYGSGTFGEHSMADVLGTMAGYVHEDTSKVILENTTWLKTQSVANKYFNGTEFLKELIDGKYTVESTTSVETSPGSGIYNDVTSYAITVPTGRQSDTGVADGTVGTFSDSGNGQGLLQAVEAVKTYIEEGMQDLLDSTDPKIKAAVQAIDLAHNTSIAQVIREAHLLKLYNIDLFRDAPMTPMDAYVFAQSLDSYALQTGYGQPADFIERIASNDLYGDAIKFTMRQARNAEILAPLGVNTERFNVPNSQYYRNPLGMIESLYNGMLPNTPAYQQSNTYPVDALEKYLTERDSTLTETGMDLQNLSPAEKDEMYYDTYWENANEFIRRSMGETAVSTAIMRNLKILGNKIEIIDLDGRRLQIADITPAGLQNLDTATLITVLFDLVNRVLYGNIGVTKNTNPFYTEELVYGVVEAMGAINVGSIDFLMQTYIGESVLSEFLLMIANRFKNINTVFDTRLDRNDPGAYGGAGPGYDPRNARSDSDNQI